MQDFRIASGNFLTKTGTSEAKGILLMENKMDYGHIGMKQKSYGKKEIFSEGLKTGIWITFYESGQKLQEGNYS